MSNIKLFILLAAMFLLTSCISIDVEDNQKITSLSESIFTDITEQPQEIPFSLTPTTTPTPPPIPKPTSRLSPYPAPGEPSATPARETEIPGLDWKGPGIIYIKSSDLMLSNFDGTHRSVFGYSPINYYATDFSPETGAIVFESENSLWFVDRGKEAKEILSLEHYIESPIISDDGTKIAYSLAFGFGNDDIQQLWIVNPDGTGNTMVSEDTGQYITETGPFRLRPIAWSADNTKIYMVTTTDSEATPTGMYVADLAMGEISKVLTPQVTLWDVSFSSDRNKIAYMTHQWVPGQNWPEWGPPFTLNVTDVTNGATRILLESNTDLYFYPIWSRDGSRIAYVTRKNTHEGDIGLFIIDIASGTTALVVTGSDISRLRPWKWLSEDRLIYSEGDLSTSTWNPYTRLNTISIDGSDQHIIDSGEAITVLGVMND